jgi:hypothetical protein
VAPSPINLFPSVAASIGDPDGTRTITAIVALLVVLGIGLTMLAVWLFKTTRPDPELLAPLDVMGERRWRRADPVWQRRRLDEVRPAEARPLTPSVAPPEFDEAFDQGPTASGFDDLHDPVDHQPIDSHNDDDRHDDRHEDEDQDDETVEVDDEAEAPDETEADRGVPAGEVSATAATPPGINRPVLDDLPDHELDPALLEMAMRELEAELAARRNVIDGDDQR